MLVLTFYKFKPISKDDVKKWRDNIESLGKKNHIKGLFLIGEEGINATVAGGNSNLSIFMKELVDLLSINELDVKESSSEFNPFLAFRVKIRKEIVTLGDVSVVPNKDVNHHLSPEEWHKTLLEEDVVLLDTRNWYETQMGKFDGALDLEIDEFQEFPERIKHEQIPKDKKVLMYCTGGIRCEKAIIEMQNQGYENVYQLEGGIINYLKKYPNGKWNGECFVFDHRVSVDSNLKPSQIYSLCPHCGQPAKEIIDCIRCDDPVKICEKCLQGDELKRACSKNCAYHYARGSQIHSKKQSENKQMWNKKTNKVD